MSAAADPAWVAKELRRAAGQFAELLRAVPDTAVRVPNLEWSVAELGAHLAAIPELYRVQHDAGADFVLPADFTVFSAQVRAHITTTDAAELADQVEQAADELITGGEPSESRWLYGLETSRADQMAGMLVECVLHGQDLARLGGTAPQLTEEQALAALPQVLRLASVFVDPTKARRASGTFGVSFRDGPEYTYVVSADGELTIEEGRPARADAWMRARPAAFVASSLGRVSRLKIALTGAIVVYGRKPWRLARLGSAVIDGV